MMLSIISFSDAGEKLAEAIQSKRENCITYRKVPDLKTWTGEQFAANHGILFIGACGIAVRAIAPFVEDKLADSPVLVMDDMGIHVIPILSGHVGGANKLAEELASLIGARPVITTATDIHHKFAVDVFATECGFAIENREGIARISSRILQGDCVTIAIAGLDKKACALFLERKMGSCPEELVPVADTEKADIFVGEKKPEAAILWLRPKAYIVGMGCKKGKNFEALLSFLLEQLVQQNILPTDLYALASIDVKKDEDGLVKLADYLKIPFITNSQETLAELKGEFSHSEFVEQQVGVGNVCERAAFAACDSQGSLVASKTAKDGMTLAIVKRNWQL